MYTVQDFEDLALETLPKSIANFYITGADQEQTLNENREAFSRFRIRPRHLRDVSKRDLTTTVLGQKMDFPIGVSPTAFQGKLHPDGEKATAQACAEVGSLMIVSTSANFSMEEVAIGAPESQRWYQMFIYKDREVTKSMVRRAESNGYKALVLTIDRPIFTERGDRKRDIFDPSTLRMPNYQQNEDVDLKEYLKKLMDSSLTWDDVRWLCGITKLPVVVKGVLTAEDAELAILYGASAILVSNHGGRQLDGAPATIEALPEVVRAVRDRCDIYLDGGVRTGKDAFKALGLGAKAVFVGRPALWGLVYDGAKGVKEVLTILKDELDRCMALAGCRNVEELHQLNVVVPHKFYYQ